MIGFARLALWGLCLVCWAAGQQQEGPAAAPAPPDAGHRVLTDDGYVIRYGDAFYRYPFPVERRVQQVREKPIQSNEIGGGDVEERAATGRPLFFFTYEGAAEAPRQRPLGSGPYIEIRRKRDVGEAAAPESGKIGKLRRKRTYCRKCGGGGGGGYYVPVSYAVYPVYYGGGGGGGRGCNTCGGGYPSHGGGGGGGGGGSFSYSSSSAQSSSGSFGWGKK